MGMLTTIIRVLMFLTLVAAGIWGLFLLIQDPGGITIRFAGREYFFAPLHFAALLTLGVVGLWLVIRIAGLLIAVLRFLDGDETAISRFFNRSRERRGLEAMARGMAALASGDAKAARSSAEKAELLLQRPELTRLLNAQAAELSGDDLRAETYYRALAEDPATAFIGVRGLLNRALEKGQTDRALKLADAAARLHPKDATVLDTLYTLQTRTFDWDGARKTLAGQRRHGYLPKPEANRRDAMLALAQAEDAEGDGEAEQARKLALEAARLDPENDEAVTTAVRHLVGAGSKRAAARLVSDAWRRKPSPALAAAFASIEPGETPEERRKRFQKLLSVYPTHAESRLLAAELALMTKDWEGARKAIAELEEEEPSARSCLVRAAIARGEGASEVEVRAWLARALEAQDDGRGGDIRHHALLPLLIGAGDEEPAPTGAAASDDGEAGTDSAETAGAASPDSGETPEAAETETRERPSSAA
ncbi:MAG TPA: heme biosynthesis HemY N-terminal domain-containing protein [Thermohalobaculum sp.]|nr:heme biosynthesis HemY N-terminal domain-containing protein [Thermohalobaculum sp.]